MVLSVIVLITLAVIFSVSFFLKNKDVAIEEVEYMIAPSGTKVNLLYRFKGERKWKTIDWYYNGAYDGWYGHFSPMEFHFREDGEYGYLKKQYTKERIISHNERMLSRYHNTIKERDGWGKRDKEIRSKNKVSKRI